MFGAVNAGLQRRAATQAGSPASSHQDDAGSASNSFVADQDGTGL
jgi:hypothetical protein